VTYEFVSELVDERAKESESIAERAPIKNGTSLSVPETEIDPSSRYEQ
jgi:hypothetical protein